MQKININGIQPYRMAWLNQHAYDLFKASHFLQFQVKDSSIRTQQTVPRLVTNTPKHD